MSDTFEERPSDSPLVTRVVLSRAETDGVNLLPADGNCYMFLQTVKGKTSVAVGGPLTKAMFLPVSEDTQWIGVRFKLGAFMPDLPPSKILDNVAFLPVTGRKTFWLNGSSWEFPTFENFDTFVERLVHQGLLVRDQLVEGVLEDQRRTTSLRSVQRRFLQVTGLPYNAIRQIERARNAMDLLQKGVSIQDTVDQAGYFDQPHLTRSLKQFIGQTPAQIARLSQAEFQSG
jgi:Helix-turn-helix domain